MGESVIRTGVPWLRIDAVSPRTDISDDVLVTPPARENSAADTERKALVDSADDTDYTEFLRNFYQNRPGVKTKFTDGGVDFVGGESEDEDSDREDVLQALERVSLKSATGLTDTEDDAGDAKRIPELRFEDFDERFDGDGRDTVETSTLTPRDETDMDAKVVRELQSAWDSNETSNFTNQYPRNTPSPEEELLNLAKGKRDITGVTWDSSINETPQPKFPTDGRESEEQELNFSRNASRLAMESREAMFRRAMSLLSARCTSVRRELSSANRLPFGAQVPKYFYVTQEKPVPMEPLRAWRGYNGNIYFEPIQINQMSDSETEARAKTSIPRASMPPPMTAASKAHSQPDKENRPVADNRADSRLTSKSSQGSLLMSTRQMAILDKQAVLSRYNESLHEDLTWLEGQENTGSLAVRPKTFPERSKKERERDLQYNKERIRKGSVAHKLYVENKARQKPKLSVSGGKFVPPTSMSPLLRTQTQYSLSSNRLTTNSPDPYHLNDSKLPPLDQIRATIKHMDNKSDVSFPSGKPYNRSVTLTDEMKPFVKYSPDVVAKLSQQANVC